VASYQKRAHPLAVPPAAARALWKRPPLVFPSEARMPLDDSKTGWVAQEDAAVRPPPREHRPVLDASAASLSVIPYSLLKATNGSTLVARCAGTYDANIVTIPNKGPPPGTYLGRGV
jgi:hypothetical protein